MQQKSALSHKHKANILYSTPLSCDSAVVILGPGRSVWNLACHNALYEYTPRLPWKGDSLHPFWHLSFDDQMTPRSADPITVLIACINPLKREICVGCPWWAFYLVVFSRKQCFPEVRGSSTMCTRVHLYGYVTSYWMCSQKISSLNCIGSLDPGYFQLNWWILLERAGNFIKIRQSGKKNAHSKG